MIYRIKKKTMIYLFWQSKMPQERVNQIQEWVSTLADEQVEMINDLIQDGREDAEWEKDYQNNQ